MSTTSADPSGTQYEGTPFVFLSGDEEPDSRPEYCAAAPCSTTGAHPGSRYGATGWTQRDGKLWMYGGRGFANEVETAAGCSTNCAYLADYWSVDARTGVWTWEGGSKTEAAAGQYTSSRYTHEHPGSRMMGTGWTDLRNDIAYLMGGLGYTTVSAGGHLNDLWTFNMSLVSLSAHVQRRVPLYVLLHIRDSLVGIECIVLRAGIGASSFEHNKMHLFRSNGIIVVVICERPLKLYPCPHLHFIAAYRNYTTTIPRIAMSASDIAQCLR